MHKILSRKFFIISMCLIFLISLGYIYALYSILNPQTQKENLISSQPVTSEPVSLTLTVTNPNDNSLVFNDDLLISGKASLGSVVIISSEDNDTVVNPKQDGIFSLTYKLNLGINQIIISSVDETGNIKQEQRMIYYSKEKI